MIQGYAGAAAVDGQHQVIVEAQAHGAGAELALLLPVVEACADLRIEETIVTADAGDHVESNLQALAEQNVPALIADLEMRRRDERFADQGKCKAQPDPLHDKTARRAESAGQSVRPAAIARCPEDARSARYSRNGCHRTISPSELGNTMHQGRNGVEQFVPAKSVPAS